MPESLFNKVAGRGKKMHLKLLEVVSECPSILAKLTSLL